VVSLDEDRPENSNLPLSRRLRLRRARGGRDTFTVHASAGGSALQDFDAMFAANFDGRLILFRFADNTKDARQVDVLASSGLGAVISRADVAENETTAPTSTIRRSIKL